MKKIFNTIQNKFTGEVPPGNELPSDGIISLTTAGKFLTTERLESRLGKGADAAYKEVLPEVGLDDVEVTRTIRGFGKQKIAFKFIKPQMTEGCVLGYYGKNYDFYRNELKQSSWDTQGNKEDFRRRNRGFFERALRQNFRIDSESVKDWDELAKKTMLIEVSRQSVPGSLKIGKFIIRQAYEPQVHVLDPLNGPVSKAMTVSELADHYKQSETESDKNVKLVKVLESIMAENKDKPYRILLFRDEHPYGLNTEKLSTKNNLKLDSILPIVDRKTIEQVNKNIKDTHPVMKYALGAGIIALTAFGVQRTILSYMPSKISAVLMTEDGGKNIELSKEPIKHSIKVQANDATYYLPLGFKVEIDGEALEGNYGTMYHTTGQNPLVKFSMHDELKTKVYLTTKKEKPKKKKGK